MSTNSPELLSVDLTKMTISKIRERVLPSLSLSPTVTLSPSAHLLDSPLIAPDVGFSLALLAAADRSTSVFSFLFGYNYPCNYNLQGI